MRKERWSKRKRLPKHDPINSEIYNLLMKENEGTVRSPERIQMDSPELDKNPTLKHDFNVEYSEEPNEFITKILKEEFWLVENSAETQLEQVIKRKRKRKGKTVYFRDFIKRISHSESDFDFIDAEIPVRSENEL